MRISQQPLKPFAVLRPCLRSNRCKLFERPLVTSNALTLQPVLRTHATLTAWKLSTTENLTDVATGSGGNAPHRAATASVRDVSRWIRESTREDWKTPTFWKEISSIGSEETRRWLLLQAFSRITEPDTGSNDFLLEHPNAFHTILDVGLQSDDALSWQILEKLSTYLHRQHVSSGARPTDDSQIYLKVMNKVLGLQLERARTFHKRLSHLPPSTAALAAFVQEIAPNKLATKRFQKLCFFLSTTKSAYSDIVNRLCAAGLYKDALAWHHVLLQHGCGPQNAQTVEPLRSHLVETEQFSDLEELDRTLDVAITQQYVRHLEATFPQGKKHSGEFNDSVLARFLATAFFSVDTTIKGLQMFGVSAIGPLSLRQLVMRAVNGGECDTQQLRAFFDQLDRASIKITDSVFTRLVRKLVHTDWGRLLYEIASCDMHCDVFEDSELQESLLNHHVAVGDQAAAERTMTILLTDSPKAQEESRRLNIQLKSALARNDKAATEQVLSQFLTAYSSLDHDCLDLTYHKILYERFLDSSEPSKMTEFLLGIWIRLTELGYRIPIAYWNVPLRALLAHGAFIRYEYIALRLTRWHTRQVLRKDTAGAKQVYSVRRRRTRALREAHDVLGRRVFTSNHLLDLVEYSFYYGRLQDAAGERFRADAAAHGPEFALAAHPMLWGVRMAMALRATGINLDWERFERRVHERIEILCRQKGITLHTGARATALPGTGVEDYVGAFNVLLDRVHQEEARGGPKLWEADRGSDGAASLET